MLVGGDGEASLVEIPTGTIRASRRVFIRRAIRALELSQRGVAYVLNGTSFATHGGVRTWDLEGGALRELSLGEVEFVDAQAATLDPRTERMVLVHEDQGEAALWLREPGGEGFSLRLDAAAFPEVTPSGRVLLRFGDGRIQLRAFTPDEEPLLDLAPPASAEGESAMVLAKPDRQGRVLYTTAPGEPLVWRDPRSGAVLERAPLAGSAPRQLLVSGDGERVAVLDREGSLELRAADDGRRLGVTPLPEGWEQAFDRSGSLHLDGPGDRFFYLGQQALVMVPLQTGDGDPGEPIEIPSADYVSGIVVSPDGRWLALYGRSLRLFDLEADTTEPVFAAEPGGAEHSVWGLTWMPDDAGLVTYGRGGVETWGRGGVEPSPCRGAGRVLFGARPTILVGAQRCELATGEVEEAPPALAWSGDGARALTYENERISVLGADGAVLGRVRKPRDLPVCRYGACVPRHALDEAGEVLAVASEEEVSVFQRRGRRLGHARASGIVGLRLSPDGAWVAVFDRGQDGIHVGLRRTRGLQESVRLRVTGAEQHAFAPDSTRAAVAHGAEVALVDLASGRTLATHEVPAPVRSLRYVDGALVIDAGSTMQVLDAEGAARAVRSELGQPWTVSPDGETLVHCERGALVAEDLLTRRNRALGECTSSDELEVSPGGRFVAVRRGAFVEVHRLADGASLRLHAPRIDANLSRQTHAYAQTDDGAYELAPGTEAGRFLYRRAGDLRRAPLVPLAEVPAQAGLVADFFAAPESAQSAPPAPEP
ncbi:MAG: hypothetical protein CMN30_06395 [Sandaracinus sp.]|nr:hypothetical protein [Sandaracinus sp.]